MGIGRGGQLPWRIKEDMARFVEITRTASAGKTNAVIMGRKTWESIPKSFRPLAGRRNIVVSSSATARADYGIGSEVHVVSSLENALSLLEEQASEIEKAFVIGGERLFKEALASPRCSRIFLTEVFGQIAPCDALFPAIPAHRFMLQSRGKAKACGDLSFRFSDFVACPEELPPSSSLGLRAWAEYPSNAEEGQYLSLVADILENGVLRGDRTGTGTLSKFGVQMRFSLRDQTLPLLTTKRVFWRGVAEELLWFIKGSTNANELKEKGIHIWDGNASREFLDSRGLAGREEGDLGPVYGFQWRHFGAEYVDFRADYSQQGVDQLQNCIQLIRSNPADRRIVMTAWNPADLDKMALPPCHMFCQFYVANGELSCQMYQRSADMGLGVPFNIASYALLTHMVAHVCGLAAGDFVHTIGDAHVYCNHVEALREQLGRAPKAFPKLLFKRSVGDIDDFVFEDFQVKGYEPDNSIKMKMAV